MQALWQAHYQILLIVFLKELIKLNKKMSILIKNAKCMESNIKIVSDSSNEQNLKMN